MSTCPKCGTTVRDGLTFCPSCGAEFDSSRNDSAFNTNVTEAKENESTLTSGKRYI